MNKLMVIEEDFISYLDKRGISHDLFTCGSCEATHVEVAIPMDVKRFPSQTGNHFVPAELPVTFTFSPAEDHMLDSYLVRVNARVGGMGDDEIALNISRKILNIVNLSTVYGKFVMNENDHMFNYQFAQMIVGGSASRKTMIDRIYLTVTEEVHLYYEFKEQQNQLHRVS